MTEERRIERCGKGGSDTGRKINRERQCERNRNICVFFCQGKRDMCCGGGEKCHKGQNGEDVRRGEGR